MMVIRRILHLMVEGCDAEKAAVGMRTPPSAVDSEDRLGDGEGDWETVAVSQNAARRCVFPVDNKGVISVLYSSIGLIDGVIKHIISD